MMPSMMRFWLYLQKKSRKMGDPTNEEVYYGPMARQI
jgi:hypothetical protein